MFEVRLDALEDACQPGFEQGRYAEGISLCLALGLCSSYSPNILSIIANIFCEYCDLALVIN